MINGTTSILKSKNFQICAAIYQLLLHMVFISRNWFVLQGPVAIILISWNVIFIWETGYWTKAIKRFALFDILKVYIPIPRSCRNIFRFCRDDNKRWIFTQWKCIKIRKSTKMTKIFFLTICETSRFNYGSKVPAVTITVFITILE
jgi:hypothetical protein